MTVTPFEDFLGIVTVGAAVQAGTVRWRRWRRKRQPKVLTPARQLATSQAVRSCLRGTWQ